MAWVREALEELGVRPSKQRGQNFLSSIQDARMLVREAGMASGDLVIEVGPGLGAMTQALLEVGVKLHAIEIEEKFARHLSEKFSSYGEALQVHISDFRKVDPSVIVFNRDCALVSNVPYVFSTDMLLWLIQHRALIRRSSLLLQKEFADRVAAPSGSKVYGSLSVLAQLFFKVRPGVEVSGQVFYPKADVASRQLHLESTDQYVSQVEDIDYFQKIVRASFSMRRKMLMNCLLSKEIFQNRSHGEWVLKVSGIPVKARAEDLALNDFIILYQTLISTQA
jgi:16S rRNA (adenine1518-N6/adenine1519-N6)-dimethyltransferase